MRILQINTVYGEGSTGKIAENLHDLCIKHNIECLSGYRCRADKSKKQLIDSIEISSAFDSRLHGVLSRFTMFKGCFSYFKTKSFLRKADAFSPDVVHIHNLHGSYVNLPLLFKYIKKHNLPVVWTFHDCWPFTAVCSHFTVARCNKWIDGCNNCPQRKSLSSCPIDFSKNVYNLKKKLFTGVKDITVVTPSNWLNNLVKQSFFKDYQVKTIYNGIDLDVFVPIASDFREKYNLNNKKIVLGVSFGWGYSKGLDVFIKLSTKLPDDYVVVLVGTDDATDSKLPDNIISIHRTNSQKELAQIYSAADVLVNPTREEVLGLVNIESLACGTPVVTFNSGGSPECIDENSGLVVECGDIATLIKEVVRVCEDKPFNKEDCINRSKFFDKNKRLEEYIELYKSKA